jgi:hypothetical protein
MQGLTLTGGLETPDPSLLVVGGGGVLNRGNLTLRDCIVACNSTRVVARSPDRATGMIASLPKPVETCGQSRCRQGTFAIL